MLSSESPQNECGSNLSTRTRSHRVGSGISEKQGEQKTRLLFEWETNRCRTTDTTYQAIVTVRAAKSGVNDADIVRHPPTVDFIVNCSLSLFRSVEHFAPQSTLVPCVCIGCSLSLMWMRAQRQLLMDMFDTTSPLSSLRRAYRWTYVTTCANTNTSFIISGK